MRINIGNNNKIKGSIIGNDNTQIKEKEKDSKIAIELIIAVISGLIVAFLIYIFGWN